MKIYILFITFFVTLTSFADEIGLLSTSQKEVTNGELVKLKIIDTRSKSYYSKYKNKRIGPLIYVLDIIEKQDELYFDAIVSEAGSKEKKLEIDDKFILKGLNYYPTKKNQIKDFITLNIPILIKKKKSLWIFVTLTLILFAFGFWWYSNRNRRKKAKRIKKIKKEKIEKILALIEKAKTSDHFAQIYLQRTDILEFFELDTKKFKEVIDQINSVQYKKEWPEEELNQLIKMMNSIRKNVRVKSGV